MNIKLMILTLSALLINGCVSHPAQYKALDVGMKNNAPCFIIPTETSLTAPLKAYPPTVMHNQRGKWEATSSPGTSGELQTLQAGECYAWSGIAWQTGEYDVSLKVMGANKSQRYATRFILTQDKNKKRVINKMEQ
ncbi:hypothetical protein RI820_001536 [Pluralibacter gergoviae]|nr:hypothetical protein [Pluralibacter gergoviae]ELC3019155.1 hypothetical protein [Pluralibacter gergoviae]ELC3021639.1 hypothetical protein [Pluralibacter gergoviae]